MSVLTALYKTYCSATKNNMVDKTDVLGQQTVLLPVYHSSKKSAGTNDMVEVTLSEDGKFVKAEWMPKDQIAIFPVTENSIIRSGTTQAPHPLCDELSYLSKELDPEKNKKYESIRQEWASYVEEEQPNRLLTILNNYLCQGTILMDCISSLFSGLDYEIGKDYEISVNENEKIKKVPLKKTFITFTVEMDESMEENLSVSKDRELHQNYIDYVRKNMGILPKEKCDVSGEMTYCVSRHRGLLGTAKLVSISNHNETYYGRFNSGEEIIHIGYETSQKIHLMLKYLLENNQNKRILGKDCYLVNWFSDDIGNKEGINLIDSISPDEDQEEDEYDSPRSFGGNLSVTVNEYITGKRSEIDSDGKFYIMILDKISNGRISIKYFRELPKSELFERVENWYNTTSWPFYNHASGNLFQGTPSLFRYADAIFGLENNKGYLECRNSKLRTKTVERLLACILEKRKFPRDLKNRMLNNLCNRSSYDKTWNYALTVGCSVFKKNQIDNQNKKEVSEMLDETKQERSYLYGRLLAIYEKIELDVQNTRDSDNKSRRATNAERLWSAFTKMPDRTLKILEGKVRPYKEILTKINYNSVKFYEGIIAEIMIQIRDAKDYEQNKNRALNEDFVFGYYAQKQNLYRKKETKQNTEIQEKGGNE